MVYLTLVLSLDQASIQNVINTTRIFINPEIPEAAKFKNRFVLWSIYYIIFTTVWDFSLIPCVHNLFMISIALHGIDTESSVPVIGGRAKPAMEEEFLCMHPKKKVSDLSDLEEEGIFAVYGVVSGIVQGEDWWYPACKCHKVVLPDSGAYYCNGCSRHVFQCIPR
jgi:hypothetical protein